MKQEDFEARWARVAERFATVSGFYRQTDRDLDMIHFTVQCEDPESSHEVIYNLNASMMVCDCEDYRRRGPCCFHMMTAASFYLSCAFGLTQFDFLESNLRDVQTELEEGTPSKVVKFSPILWGLGHGEGSVISEEDKEAKRIEPPEPKAPEESKTPPEPEAPPLPGTTAKPPGATPEPTEVPPESTETLEQVIAEVGDQLGEFADVTLVVKRTLALPQGGWLHLGAEALKLHLPLTSLPFLSRIQRALLGELAELSASPEVERLMDFPPLYQPSLPQANTRPASSPTTDPQPAPEENGAGDGEQGAEYEGEGDDVRTFWQ